MYIVSYEDPDFDVRNLVCVCDAGKEIDLNRLIVEIGLEMLNSSLNNFRGSFFILRTMIA